jgi:glycosyltransferase involved in cell wall biosynthesis
MRRVAVVFGTPAGPGGLGLQAAEGIASFARGGDRVFAIGPGYQRQWPIDSRMDNVAWITLLRPLAGRRVHLTPLRWCVGLVQQVNDTAVGRAAVAVLDRVEPDLVYAFTQVARETLDWCKSRGVPSILDNPNGHIENFRRVCASEWQRWCETPFRGHPTRAMVRRVEAEYATADRVRVSSAWAKRSMVEGGVSPEKIFVADQALDQARYRPGADERELGGPLRICFAGLVDVRKGIFHLLRAIRAARVPIQVVIVGSTGTRREKNALERESAGLALTLAPGDPVPAYRASELMVLPSLEDGFGFVVAEAMACGVAVIVTDRCGSAEWVERAQAGWIVPAGDSGALARALEEAHSRRADLAEMGARGHAYVKARAGEHCFEALRRAAWASTKNPLAEEIQ